MANVSAMTEPPPASPLPPNVAVNGDAIRARRIELGFNLRTFAARATLSLQYVSQIERGNRPRVSPATFLRLVEALEMAEAADELRAA